MPRMSRTRPKQVAPVELAITRAPDLGRRLAEIRALRSLTLRQVQALSGIPMSTLSKVQNGQATLSYDALVRLAHGLGIEVSDLFSGRMVDIKAGRRAITRRGAGVNEPTTRYVFELLCSELIRKQMNPAILQITARSLAEAGGLSHHEGEEFMYVLSGTVEIHSEDYRPTRLEQGDSLYLDSSSGHAYVNVGRPPARLLAVTTHLSAGAVRVANLAGSEGT